MPRKWLLIRIMLDRAAARYGMLGRCRGCSPGQQTVLRLVGDGDRLVLGDGHQAAEDLLRSGRWPRRVHGEPPVTVVMQAGDGVQWPGRSLDVPFGIWTLRPGRRSVDVSGSLRSSAGGWARSGLVLAAWSWWRTVPGSARRGSFSMKPDHRRSGSRRPDSTRAQF